jgi:hypothetical protein
MKTPEAVEKDELKKYLAGIGAFYFLTFAPGFGKSGLPDIVACIARSSESLGDTWIKWLSHQQYQSLTIDGLRETFNAGYIAGQRSVGAFWGVEVKREGFGPTKIQEARMDEVRKAGGLTAWGTAEKVREEIETWRKQK